MPRLPLRAGASRVTVDGHLVTVLGADLRTDVALLAPSSLDHTAGPDAGFALGAPTTGNVLIRLPRKSLVGQVEKIAGIDFRRFDGSIATRQGLVVIAAISPGDSGAPVVDAQRGQVMGMVFAASRSANGRSYAVAADEIRRSIAAIDSGTLPASDMRCQD